MSLVEGLKKGLIYIYVHLKSRYFTLNSKVVISLELVNFFSFPMILLQRQIQLCKIRRLHCFLGSTIQLKPKSTKLTLFVSMSVLVRMSIVR